MVEDKLLISNLYELVYLGLIYLEFAIESPH